MRLKTSSMFTVLLRKPQNLLPPPKNASNCDNFLRNYQKNEKYCKKFSKIKTICEKNFRGPTPEKVGKKALKTSEKA